MKHLLSTVIIFTAACAINATAQTVVIKDKDGLSHNFAADRIQEITFIDPATIPLEFTTIKADGYSSGAASLTLATEDNSKSLSLWIYGPENAVFLNEGVYSVDASNAPFTIDTDANYSFVKENEKQTGIKTGTMTITRSQEIYDISFDFTLVDGATFKAKYTGKVEGYSPYINLTASTVKQTEINNSVPGEFYLKFNDLNYSYEMAVDFFTQAGEKKLPAGQYTYSESKEPGTFSQLSYLDIYSPYTSNRFAENSTIDISYDGDIATISMNLILQDERVVNLNYSGPIEWLEQPEAQEVVFTDGQVTWSGSKARTLQLTTADQNTKLVMDVWFSESDGGIVAGTYELRNSTSPFSVDSDNTCTYLNNSGNGFTSGTMDVAINDKTLSLTINFILADGTPFNATFSGEIEGAIPEKEINKVASQVKYSEFNNQQPGQFLLNINDADWTMEMSLYLTASSTDTLLPAGTYTYDGTSNAMTIDAKTSINFYNPSSNHRVAEGSTVTIEYSENNNANINMVLNLNDGRILNVTYTGEIK